MLTTIRFLIESAGTVAIVLCLAVTFSWGTGPLLVVTPTSFHLPRNAGAAWRGRASAGIGKARAESRTNAHSLQLIEAGSFV